MVGIEDMVKELVKTYHNISDKQETMFGGGAQDIFRKCLKCGGVGEDAAWFSTYDLEYLDSDEETDIECSDGQSAILRKYTTTDMDSVMAAIEYFIRTGKLWNGIQWMKSWREWVEEDK